ncbi:tripartite tricarboxylate transporter permease [Arthrobacter sp. VKM Ac-2550]|uniref:tripartite tricarboxylate transporter permease n=1 Tax=Crystallibacter permensis TaxID=1938888 RepID=UPI002226E5E5|nr:tripartite tricarboxylate transporter permease [Arthrobacter sp. VKM Ac-2550]MCW2133125.1 TctA family transporter [Arthrobacter sp. VKM Ac-2550]
MLDSAMAALASLADPALLLMLLVGVVAGLVMGLIPGLGGTGAVAILLPITFGMEPAPALALLIGALAVVHTSDTVSAVLLGAPGSASASVTMLDGYSMARKGQAKRALSLAFLSSMAGGIIGAVGLTLAIPLARPLVLSFASPELFMLTVLGVALAAVLSRGNVVKGLVAGLMGLLLGMVGTSPTTAEERFTFGSLFLGDGLSLVAVALGIFGLAEIASRASQRRGENAPVKVTGGWGSGIREWLTHWSQVLRGSLIGIWAGVLPGVGATAGTWLAYGQAVATAKDKRQFGKGDPRGIVGPESANNSVEAGDLIPTLLFGIPGGVPSAMLLGMLLTYGIQPGPSIITDHLDLMYLIVWSFAIASVLGALFCFLTVRPLASLTKVPFAVLASGLVAIMLLGSFQEGGQLGDLWVMVLLGIAGWVLKSTGFPRAPFLIGFVLAIPLERYYFLTDSLYNGFEWMLRPGTMVFLAILVLPILWNIFKWIRARRRLDRDDDPQHENAVDAESPLKNSTWSLATALVVILIFAGSLVISSGFSPEARLVPQLVGWGGLIMGLALLGQEIVIRRRAGQLQAAMPVQVAAEAAASSSVVMGSPGSAHAVGSTGATGSAYTGSTSAGPITSAGTGTGSRRTAGAVATAVPSAESIASDAPVNGQTSAGQGPGWTKEAGFAFKTFGWMAGFLILIGILGYLVAVMIFVPAFLLIVARAKTKTTIIYTAVLYVVLLALPTLLPIDLPQGWLSQLVG